MAYTPYTPEEQAAKKAKAEAAVKTAEAAKIPGVTTAETVKSYQQKALGLPVTTVGGDIVPSTATLTAPTTQPTTGLTTGATPAQIAKPIVSTPAPIVAEQPATTTSTKSKGLFGIDTDWYNKLNPSRQDSVNKALMAAGFYTMKEGGRTTTLPVSASSIFGGAGQVGLQAYEADQAAKARAASEAEKLKFEQEYKTAKLGLTGARVRSGGGKGVDDKDILKAAGADYSNYLAGAKTKQVIGLPHDDSTAVTVGQWTYKMDKNGKLLVSSPKTNRGDVVVWHDASGLTNNLKNYWTNQLHPERGGTATTGKSTGGAYLAVHDGKQGMYDPSTKMFTPL